jgi:hypothetical protein
MLHEWLRSFWLFVPHKRFVCRVVSRSFTCYLWGGVAHLLWCAWVVVHCAVTFDLKVTPCHSLLWSH